MVDIASNYLGRAGAFVKDAIPDILKPELPNPFSSSEENWEEIFELWAAEWQQLPEQALVLIGENAPELHRQLEATAPSGAADADQAAEMWRRVFDQAGLEAHLVSGLYQPAGEKTEPAVEHTWLQVEGCLVDPTAGQYGDTKASFDYYQDSTIEAS